MMRVTLWMSARWVYLYLALVGVVLFAGCV
jgi:hypothetical protein